MIHERIAPVARFVLAAVVFGLAACGGPTSSSEIAVVRATTSFGFCAGYCRTTLEITSSEVVYVKEGWKGEPPLVRREALTSSEWNDLLRAIDRGRLQSLPDEIGCPDCTDQGAEAVGVISPDWSKTVTFDFGAEVASIQPLLDRVRALRRRFEPAS